MQTKIHPNIKLLPDVDEAEAILRSCVHCGFCTAVCPTYQELGDDLDSPRGRIYLIKTMLEDDALNPAMNTHLDRCLTCRSCETTCPSGVEYGRLLDIGRHLAVTRYQPSESKLRRLKIAGLRFFLPKPKLFSLFYSIGLWFRPLLPEILRSKMPLQVTGIPGLNQVQRTAVKPRGLVLQGCVQRSLTPGVNVALEYLLGEQGVALSYLKEEGCCGAVDYHLGYHEAGLKRARELLDRLEPALDDVDWIISTASGCGVTLKDYPAMLKADPVYFEKAKRVVEKIRDASEVLSEFQFRCEPKTVAVHTPCTLQHGQMLPNTVSEILTKAGARLVPVAEAHLCCGSAGTYSVLEADLSDSLSRRKSQALNEHAPEVIVTANVGCQTQLAAMEATAPVMHWLEFLAKYRRTEN